MNNDITSRIPPNDKDAEQAVLGAVFLSQDALIEAMEFVDADDFYQHANQLVFQAMMNLNDEEEPVDVVTVQNELDRLWIEKLRAKYPIVVNQAVLKTVKE